MFFDTYKDEFDMMNESYVNINFDVDESIYEYTLESYINDYTIFEATLRRDFLEVNGILTEDGNKNFLKAIFERILNAFRWIKNKIKELWNKIFKKGNKEENNSSSSSSSSDTKSSAASSSSSTSSDTKSASTSTSSSSSTSSDTNISFDVPVEDDKEETIIVKNKKMTIKQMIKEYSPLINKYKDKLKDFKISGFNLKPIINRSILHNKTLYKTFDIFEEIGSIIDKIEDPNTINKVKEIGEFKIDSKEIYQSIRKAYFFDEPVEFPFKEKTDQMIKLITDANFKKNHIKSLAEEIRDLYKEINRLEDRTRKKIKELDRDVQKISKYDTDSISDKQNSINTATELLKQINRLGKFQIGFDSTEIKIAKEYIKQKTRLFIATVKYLEQFEKEGSQNASYLYDIDYINAMSEAVMYELEL